MLAEPLETVFVGGGTPTFTEPAALGRLLARAAARGGADGRGEPRDGDARACSPARRRRGVNRVSLGAQSFQPGLLSVLERRATPDDVRRAVHTLRDANFDNISLDFIYGVPGQSASDLEADIEQALLLRPEHMSWYELEAKPGTRFTHRFGEELARQAEAMEGYFELVVDAADGGGLPLVRDGELRALARSRRRPRPPFEAQPRLLARSRLPRHRDRRRVDRGRAALAEHATARGVHRRRCRGRTARARDRAVDRRDREA